MTMPAGTRLGPYELIAPIGAGGMGEVYLGRDTQLDRDVALKILPAAFASDPDRLMRFTREAKTLASLNHPNIAAIYGIESAALVMELVDGEDLSAVMARGPIAMDDAVVIARQIADALEAAHEAGIVHRDLKPANIKVRGDGAVKVLDFGLPKAMDPAFAPAVDSQGSSPAYHPATMTSPAMTAMGIILGTAAYMAPEQARGKAVDKRADIWAFGVVVYEMLSGRQLFAGETMGDTLAAVLRADIDVSTLPSTVPVWMRQLLVRCLEKDVRKRLRDIGEARLWLEGAGAKRGDVDAATQPPVRSLTRLWRSVALLSAAAAVAAGAWIVLSVPPTAMPVHASIQLPEGTEYIIDPASPPNFAVSPDGSTVVFAATPLGGTTDSASLYLRRLSGRTATQVLDSSGGRVPVFSPDGLWVAFLTGTTLKKVSVSGGAPSTITAGLSNVWGIAWLAGGTIVYSNAKPTGEMLFSVSDKGGTATLLSRVDRLDTDNSFPRALDGGDLLVSIWNGGLYTDANIATFSMKSRSITALVVEGGSQGQVVSGRYLVYARGSELLARPYAGGTNQTGAVKVVEGVLTDLSYATSQFDVSRSGTLVYAPAAAVSQAPSLCGCWPTAGWRRFSKNPVSRRRGCPPTAVRSFS